MPGARPKLQQAIDPIWFLLWFWLLLSGCSASHPSQTVAPTSPILITPSPFITAALPTSLASDDTTDPAPVQTSEPYPTLPSPQYEITATLNYSSHHLGADERILYTNRTGEALNELVIKIRRTGRIPVERDTCYRVLRVFDDPGAPGHPEDAGPAT